MTELALAGTWNRVSLFSIELFFRFMQNGSETQPVSHDFRFTGT
jgi:hypothetical protein